MYSEGKGKNFGIKREEENKKTEGTELASRSREPVFFRFMAAYLSLEKINQMPLFVQMPIYRPGLKTLLCGGIM